MSDFDDANPFADPNLVTPAAKPPPVKPKSNTNPFPTDDDDDFNPRGSTPTTVKTPPAVPAKATTTPPPVPAKTTAPPVVDPFAKPPVPAKKKVVDNPFIVPPATPSSDPTIGAASDTMEVTELRRQLEIANKKLQKNTQKIEELEDRLYPLIPNWPGCYPIVFHDIMYDMKTPKAVSLCRHCYSQWWLTCMCYLLNCACYFALLTAGVSGMTGFTLLSLAYLMVMPVLEFFTWYWKVYHGLKADKSSTFFWFFVFFGVHIVIQAVMVIGSYDTASAGLLSMIKAFDAHEKTIGFMILSCLVLWLICLGDSLYLIGAVNSFYKTSGSISEQPKKKPATTLKEPEQEPIV